MIVFNKALYHNCLKQAELSTLKVAKEMGVNPQTIYAWIAGRRMPSTGNLEILASTLQKHNLAVAPLDFYKEVVEPAQEA